MNFISPVNTDLLLEESQKEALYLKLIEQINKDFNLANEGVDFPKSISPEELKIQLHEKVYRLIQYKLLSKIYSCMPQSTTQVKCDTSQCLPTNQVMHTNLCS